MMIVMKLTHGLMPVGPPCTVSRFVRCLVDISGKAALYLNISKNCGNILPVVGSLDLQTCSSILVFAKFS